MEREPTLSHDYRGKGCARAIEQEIAALATRQHGVVARRQLRTLGLTDRAIEYRLSVDRLHVLHRGVYAVGHEIVSRHGRWMAVVLAAGDDAVLSHRSAASLWGIASPTSRLEVTTPRRIRSRRPLRLHEGVIPDDERAIHEAIPVTTPARTLLDLAATAPGRTLERAVHEAEVLRLGTDLSLDAVLQRHRGRRGARRLAAIVAKGGLGRDRTRSEIERRFVEMIERTGLPRPEANVLVEAGGRCYEADAVWREARLIVELDGQATHDTTNGFEGDRARDRALTVAGWRVVRVTWRQLAEEAEDLASDLRQLL